MFVCKLRTPSCSHYEHFHVYLACRRQTGTVVTRQTFDRAPRLTKWPLHTFQGVTMPKFVVQLSTAKHMTKRHPKQHMLW